jgi:hypothetical protein
VFVKFLKSIGGGYFDREQQQRDIGGMVEAQVKVEIPPLAFVKECGSIIM